MEKIQKEKVFGEEENQKFSLRYIKFGIPVIYSSIDIKLVIGYYMKVQDMYIFNVIVYHTIVPQIVCIYLNNNTFIGSFSYWSSNRTILYLADNIVE